MHVITDGGVAGRNGSRDWHSDSGNRSLTVMGVAGLHEGTSFESRQYGHYLKKEQTAAPHTLYSASNISPALKVYEEWLLLN